MADRLRAQCSCFQGRVRVFFCCLASHPTFRLFSCAICIKSKISLRPNFTQNLGHTNVLTNLEYVKKYFLIKKKCSTVISWVLVLLSTQTVLQYSSKQHFQKCSSSLPSPCVCSSCPLPSHLRGTAGTITYRSARISPKTSTVNILGIWNFRRIAQFASYKNLGKVICVKMCMF